MTSIWVDSRSLLRVSSDHAIVTATKWLWTERLNQENKPENRPFWFVALMQSPQPKILRAKSDDNLRRRITPRPLNFSTAHRSHPPAMTSQASLVGPSGASVNLDVVFMVDATGSMRGVLGFIRAWIKTIATYLQSSHPECNVWFGAVCYRDPIDSGTSHMFYQLAEGIVPLREFFQTVSGVGGNGGPEDWAGAYELVTTEIDWRKGSGRLVIHYSDSCAHGPRFCGEDRHHGEEERLTLAMERVARDGIVVAGFDLNGGGEQSFRECKAIYDAAGGRYFTSERRPCLVLPFDRKCCLCCDCCNPLTCCSGNGCIVTLQMGRRRYQYNTLHVRLAGEEMARHLEGHIEAATSAAHH